MLILNNRLVSELMVIQKDMLKKHSMESVETDEGVLTASEVYQTCESFIDMRRDM